MEEIRYITANIWGKFKPKKFTRIQGVQVKVLSDDHKLCGQKGLFATQEWEQFDIVGEYVGRIIDNYTSNAYVADLYRSDNGSNLGIDALNSGNELRYINDYRGIKDKPNCKISKATIDRKPVILIVIIDKIEEGEELLMDYGEGYWGEKIVSQTP